MPKKFTLDGEVGWEINTRVVKGILHAAGGEDIVVDFSSPGGSVYTGIKVFNMFKNYSGKVTFNIIGLAASMGSYIPLAGDEITAEANSVYMIHNVWTYTSGDHKDLRKTADVIEGLSKMLAKEYTKKTGISAEDIAKMMNDDTYLFGSEIRDAGFVDSINGEADKDPDAKTVSFASAKEDFNAVMSKLKSKEEPEDYEQIAALITESNAGSLLTDNKPATAESRDNPKTEVKKVMTIEELRAKHPDVAAKLIEEGRAAGVTAERARVSGHLTLGEASGDTKTAFAAIKDGAEMDVAFQATYLAAGMRKGSIEDRQDDDNDAGAADGAAPDATVTTDEETIAAGLEKKFGVVPEKK